MITLSKSDAQLLAEFLAFLRKHGHLLEGYNADVPIEGYILAGCLTVLSFDYLCTFDQEVNYVWTCPWSFGLPLFYINRYAPFVNTILFVYINSNHMTSSQCNTLVQFVIWSIAISSFFSQLIIVLRTCALWRNQITIVTTLLLLLLGTMATTFFFTWKQLSHMSFAPTPSFIPGCLIIEGVNVSLYVYITLFIAELIIIGLTVVKAIQHLRRNQRSWLSQLYKNGIFYCICILLFTLINIVVHLLPKLPYVYKQTFRMPQHVFHSIFSSRVILQILKYRHHFAEQQRTARRRSIDVYGTHNIFTTIIPDTMGESSNSGDIELSESTCEREMMKEMWEREGWEGERVRLAGHGHGRYADGSGWIS
ncbi:hypothetical protein CC1G_03489 [Coprinopsis cinerea okayama7|uniref:DUF6533 domain-containing protein n=1 Tax=Coprinopsis cinerea (strain Okayama-7 / 130 / ATCC MYA-4618 / FGSC 9003) TaxID=240176 RepID=A8NCD1_COPC7|nr:hypothetical protein CC1G_03489 [Coprinopsis cinerea okayama7\|eukprot:XP_001832475.1 hypothetical protein CC1G_03489 [Coprinopsis cinerea okayama7\